MINSKDKLDNKGLQPTIGALDPSEPINLENEI